MSLLELLQLCDDVSDDEMRKGRELVFTFWPPLGMELFRGLGKETSCQQKDWNVYQTQAYRMLGVDTENICNGCKTRP